MSVEGLVADLQGKPGKLNYIITRLVIMSLPPEPRYEDFNRAVGVLECAKLEFYRRMVAAYEDRKRSENGDVYPMASRPSTRPEGGMDHSPDAQRF